VILKNYEIDKLHNYDNIYLSPHPDDAALSCGGTIVSRNNEGKRQLVVTLCTAIPDCVQQMWSIRLIEEKHGMDTLGTDCLMGNILDAPFRHNSYKGDSLFELPQSDDTMLNETMFILDRLAQQNRNALLHAPLGVGNHVDHVNAFNAAQKSWPQEKLLFYEDIPYTVHDPDAIEKRIVAIGKKMDLETVDISDSFDKKMDAVSKYRSQVCFLFDTNNIALTVLKTEAQRVLPDGLGERFWKIVN
jgi:LmbE family N-acetylglucosaminyl deacetylase